MIVFEPYKKRPLSDFHEELFFEFPNAPAQMFDYYLVVAAIEMARKGHLIRRRVVITPECGVTGYSLKSPDGMDICGILQIRRVGGCGCGSDNIPRSFTMPDNAKSCSCSNRMCWYDSIEDMLHIDAMHTHGQYWVEVAVTPRMGDCELPDVLYTEHLPTLVMGTKAKIYLLANKPWTNLNAGRAFYNEFLKSIERDALRTSTHKQLGAIKMNFGRAM